MSEVVKGILEVTIIVYHCIFEFEHLSRVLYYLWQLRIGYIKVNAFPQILLCISI
jgi:hypothetical protein